MRGLANGSNNEQHDHLSSVHTAMEKISCLLNLLMRCSPRDVFLSMNHILPDNRPSSRNILVSCGSPEWYDILLLWAGRSPCNHVTALSWSARSRRRLEIFEVPAEPNQDESRRDRTGHACEL